MKIGLLDADHVKDSQVIKIKHFPNLALMKFSSYYKSLGYEVELYNQMSEYDIVIVSKVFDDTYTRKYPYHINAKKVYYGGYGYGVNKVDFIDDFDKIMPDYELYKVKNKAVGFLTRGCPRNCDFCIVSKIEGRKAYKVAALKDFWNGEKEIILNDPNILAYPNHIELLRQLIDTKCKIEFNQGLDIRMLTDSNVELINRLKLKRIHFAWDFPEDNLLPLFKKWRSKLNFRNDQLMVYVLVNFNSTHEQDLMRIYALRDLGYDPYVMTFDKPNAPRQTKELARWVNNYIIFKKCKSFEDYSAKAPVYKQEEKLF